MEKNKQILELKDKGLTYRQIAKEMKCSIGKIYYHCHYEELKEARKPFRKFIQAKPKVKEDPEQAKVRQLKYRYDLGYDEYTELYETQNHRCAICNRRFSLGGRKGLYVDHNHKTGKVRGLLCPACNSALGKFQDSVDILTKAIEYLQNESMDI